MLLGLMSLTFGLLKFINPFKGWYATQIETSGLPEVAYAAGIGGEITVGLLYLLSLVPVKTARRNKVLLLANGGLAVMMAIAIYVHLVPDVPAEVLPLKFKPPLIPLAVLAMAFVNQWLTMLKNSVAG